MKKLLLLLTLFCTYSNFGQQLEPENLWRTKGVYDSLGNFIERAKLQSFLYAETSNKLQRLRNQDKMNMETGETTIAVYKDTFNLILINDNIFKISDEEIMTIHNKDSLTISFKGYTLPYVRVQNKIEKVDIEKFKKTLLKTSWITSSTENKSYEFTYQDNGLKKIKPVDSSSEWESEYKLQDFNGFIILQGVTSAPKLISSYTEESINYLELDYRFEIKKRNLKSN